MQAAVFHRQCSTASRLLGFPAPSPRQRAHLYCRQPRHRGSQRPEEAALPELRHRGGQPLVPADGLGGSAICLLR